MFCPLFSAFGPEPVRQRLHLGGGRVLLTTRAHYRKKVAPIREQLPALEHVLLVDGPAEPGTLDLAALMAAAEPEPEIARTRPEDLALLHFTSGTTGTPKGAMHVHEAVVAHYATGLYALDLHPGDVYWCTADPGWVTGMSYGIIAPLVHGVTAVVDEEEMDADRWYSILAEQRVTVWYTAPTALRMLMRAGTERARAHDLSALRFVASVGEPLNPEVVVWGQEAWGLPVHDNWWQTETGGIMIANFVAADIRPGSMGRPLPGIEAALVARDDDGEPVVRDGAAVLVTDPELEGELALRPGWPSMFRGYLNEEERYRRCFVGGWYLTGDLARRDADGWFWFVGRGDDVIKSAGHLIGPFEVESGLMEHPAVAEAGVDRRARPGGRAGGEGVRPAPARRRALRGAAAATSSASPASASARPWRRGRSRSPRRCPRPAAARSCAACCGPASWACPRATCPPWRPGDERRDGDRADAEVGPAAPDAARPPARGDLRRAVQRGEDPRLPARLHRRGGGGGRRDERPGTRRRRRRHLPRARARPACGGVPAEAILAEMYGKQEGCCRGRGGSMHLFDAATRFYGGNAIVAGGLPLAVGLALADKMQGRDRVTVCFFGEGAVAEGEFHESLNLAALWQLPVLFCCENNLYAMGTALRRSSPRPTSRSRPRPTRSRPGRSTAWTSLAVAEAARRAVDAVRAGGGPHFLELRTYRFRAHSMFDPERYRDKAEVARWVERDPIETLRARAGAAPRRSGRRCSARSTPRWRRPSPSPRPAPTSRSRSSPGSSTAIARPPPGVRREDELPRGHARGDPRGHARATTGCSSWVRTSGTTAAATR